MALSTHSSEKRRSLRGRRAETTSAMTMNRAMMHIQCIWDIVLIQMRILLLLILVCLLCVSRTEKNYSDFMRDLNTTLYNPKMDHVHWSYNQLAMIVDTIGPRVWGSNNLELAIDHMARQASIDGFQNIKKEPVRNFTKWVRGRESLMMLSPRPFPSKLEVTGLGFSVSG